MAETYVDENGYRRFSDSGKLVHRWVAEKKFGGPIWKGYDIHHENENKLDNRPSNLWGKTHSAHAREHARKRGL